MACNFTRLHSGEWGVRLTGAPGCRGHVVGAARRDGTRAHVVLAHRLRGSGGVEVWSVQGEPLPVWPVALESLCSSCQRAPGVARRVDGQGIGGLVCLICAARPSHTLSFC